MTIAQDKSREIIDDFAQEIENKRRNAKESACIDFRDGLTDNREEKVYKVPLEILRLRKENGRISSSVMTHEQKIGPLSDTESTTQSLLQKFLREKDPEKTDELQQLLRAEGQREPGIITVDGFLINGNRRKVALLELRKEFPADDRFQTMKVVILPGKDDEGGPPTLREIEQIENRYQLQAEGKAEYYGFDAALSIREKEKRGYSLEQQMRDDPQYKFMGTDDFSRAVKDKRKTMLEPLDLVDHYLETIGKPREYSAVSRGIGDSEGRWQAFLDLQSFCNKAKKDTELEKMGIDIKDAGEIIQAAFAAIRMRAIPGFGKLHDIMRSLHRYAKHGKTHLFELNKNVKHQLPDEDSVDREGKPLPPIYLEGVWKNKYKSEIIRRLVKAREDSAIGTQEDASLTLLSDALKKLNHSNMIVENIDISSLNDALNKANAIKKRNDELKTNIYARIKEAKKTGLLKSEE